MAKSERRSRTDELARRNVHILNVMRTGDREITAEARQNAVTQKLTLGIERSIGLRDDTLGFFVRAEELNVVRSQPVQYLAVGCLEKTVLVDSRIGAERTD